MTLRKQNHGLTLAETMISIVILGLVMLAVLGVNSYIFRLGTMSDQRQVASTIASNQLAIAESILKVNFHTPSTSINTELLHSGKYPAFYFQLFDLGYEDPAKSLRGVAVRVVWDEKGEQKH